MLRYGIETSVYPMNTLQMMRSYSILICLALTAFANARADVCSEPRDREFDFWIGEWDIENRQANPGNLTDPNLYPTGAAIARVSPAAGGCAIVELWEGELSWGRVLGFSLRSYDASAEKWTLLLNWPAPNAGVPGVFATREGGFRHGRGEFFNSSVGTDGKTRLSRFTFADINEERYRWDSAASVDGGVTWQTSWIMEGTRRADADSSKFAPVALAEDDMGACAAAEGSNSLAYLNGKWSGKTDGGVPVELEVLPIMGGCAFIEFLNVGGEQPWEEFRVRAYQPAKSQWEQYSVSNQAEGLLESASEIADGALVWIAASKTGANEEWQLDDEQVLHWRRSQADGESILAELAHHR